MDDMDSSFWTEDRYATQFFCAFCGGPFARVRRTNEQYRSRRVRSTGTSRSSKRRRTTDVITGEEGQKSSNRAYCPAITSDADQGAPVETHNAYPGRDVREKDLRWTRVLRALVHKHAQVQPEDGQDQAYEDQDVYLTGRGRVREDGSWAEAFASIQSDLANENDTADEDEVPTFADDHKRFHLYQEPDRNDRIFLISSVPFHEECWDIMLQALHHSRATRSLPPLPMGQMLDLDVIWSYLVNLIPIAVNRRLSDLTVDAMTRGNAGGYIRRLTSSCMGNEGYREAQPCGEGPRWNHVPGQHWLVVNPQQTALSRNPFEPSQRGRRAPWTRSQTNESLKAHLSLPTRDPFGVLPDEVLVVIVDHLTAKETFRWRSVSVPLNRIAIPHRIYRRFTKQEMAFMPTFIRQLEEAEASEDRTEIHWKQIFEQASSEWRNNDGLRNRRRIWKILHPMAEEMIERSSQSLERLGCPSTHLAKTINVTRGSVGLMSGAEGDHKTALFLCPTAKADTPMDRSSSSSKTTSIQTVSISDSYLSANSDVDICKPQELCRSLRKIQVWLDTKDGHVRGFELVFVPEIFPLPREGAIVRRRFGSRSATHESYLVASEHAILTGFIVSWYGGCIRGLQCVFESGLQGVTEYAEYEFLSPRFGTWDGPKRRLVAPRLYRHLSGVTGFVNTQGSIETLAILEEKITIPSHDGHGMLIPPSTVPLSHQEASMWMEIPPSDVDISERQGPTLDDWRVRGAEHKIFARTPVSERPMRLQSICVHAAGDYISGLAFIYCDGYSQVSMESFGACENVRPSRLDLSVDEQITGVVISHGPGGIHSLQLIAMSIVGPPAGARYLGTHTLYAQGPIFPRDDEFRLGNLIYLTTPVIGLHWIYSTADNRILQLGLITRPEPLVSHPSITVDSLAQDVGEVLPSGRAALAIPLLDTDELRNPWVDGRPPNSFIRGRKESDSIKTMELHVGATFAGWIDLRHVISEVVIFGQMEGLIVRYKDDAYPERSFGHSGRGLSKEIISMQGQGSITRIVRRGPCEPTSTSLLDRESMSTFLLLNRHDPLPPDSLLEVDSDHLVGLQLSFNSARILSWHPLFELAPSVIERRAIVSKQLHLHGYWRPSSIALRHPTAEYDSDLLGGYCTLADLCYSSDPLVRVDGVRGYTAYQHFCGLRFRRGGCWDVEPLGQATAYEITFLLNTDEDFTSICVSESGQQGEGQAVAFYTSQGRSTPSFGQSSQPTTSLKRPPPGRRLIGIYMAFKQPDLCFRIGIIHDVRTSISNPHAHAHLHSSDHALLKTPLFPPGETLQPDVDTDLDWAISPRHLPPDFRLSVDLNASHGSCTSVDSSRRVVMRAYSIVSAGSLQGIDADVNQVRGRFGLKALRFRGDATMYEVLLGEWRPRTLRTIKTAAPRMVVDGAGGERIVRARISYYDSPRYGNLIIGLHLLTDRGGWKSLVRWREWTEEEPESERVWSKTIAVAKGEEVVGWHYVVGLYVHDLGFITRTVVGESSRG